MIGGKTLERHDLYGVAPVVVDAVVLAFVGTDGSADARQCVIFIHVLDGKRVVLACQLT